MTPSRPLDPADAIAGVAITGWQRLLRIHHHRLKRADLEDCLGQATLELLAAAARGQRFPDTDAIRAALDMRFQSRIIDRQRALGGRCYLVERELEQDGPGAYAALKALVADYLDQAQLLDRVPMAGSAVRHYIEQLVAP